MTSYSLDAHRCSPVQLGSHSPITTKSLENGRSSTVSAALNANVDVVPSHSGPSYKAPYFESEINEVERMLNPTNLFCPNNISDSVVGVEGGHKDCPMTCNYRFRTSVRVSPKPVKRNTPYMNPWDVTDKVIDDYYAEKRNQEVIDELFSIGGKAFNVDPTGAVIIDGKFGKYAAYNECMRCFKLVQSGVAHPCLIGEFTYDYNKCHACGELVHTKKRKEHSKSCVFPKEPSNPSGSSKEKLDPDVDGGGLRDENSFGNLSIDDPSDASDSVLEGNTNRERPPSSGTAKDRKKTKRDEQRVPKDGKERKGPRNNGKEYRKDAKPTGERIDKIERVDGLIQVQDGQTSPIRAGSTTVRRIESKETRRLNDTYYTTIAGRKFENQERLDKVNNWIKANVDDISPHVFKFCHDCCLLDGTLCKHMIEVPPVPAVPLNLGEQDFGRNKCTNNVITREAKAYNKAIFDKKPSKFDPTLLINHELGRLPTHKDHAAKHAKQMLPDTLINEKLFAHLKMSNHAKYPSRDVKMEFLNKLTMAYLKENNVKLDELTPLEINMNLITIQKVCDEKDSSFCLQEANVEHERKQRFFTAWVREKVQVRKTLNGLTGSYEKTKLRCKTGLKDSRLLKNSTCMFNRALLSVSKEAKTFWDTTYVPVVETILKPLDLILMVNRPKPDVYTKKEHLQDWEHVIDVTPEYTELLHEDNNWRTIAKANSYWGAITN